MKFTKLSLTVVGLLLLLNGAAAIPEMPHHVYGDINDLDGPVDNINVSFHYDGDFVNSTLTDSTGSYGLKIPYSSNYEGQDLDIYVEDTDTGKGIVFEQGASDQVNYEGRNIVQESFAVSGTITKDSNEVDSVSVKFYNDGNSISSTTTDSNGDYSVDISFSDGYDGEELVLHVNDSETDQTTTFVTRGSDTVDHSISSDSTTNSEDDSEEEDSSSSSSNNNNDDDEDTDTTDTGDDSNDDSDSESSEDETQGAVVEITDVSSSPQDPEVGEKVQIYVTVTNTGDESTDHEVSINVGEEELQKTVEDFEAGDTELVTFEKEFDSGDTYAVSAGDQSHDINVGASQTEETPKEEEDNRLGFIQIMGIVGVLLMLIVVIYLFVDSRRGKSDMDEEQKGALEAFKEKKKKSKDSDDDGFGWNYADED